ncbi:hypothetical protein K1719_022332 [Acacia pycnantha]|nr:hypothetical protein K1719_022332 [Acacia pycnantha]
MAHLRHELEHLSQQEVPLDHSHLVGAIPKQEQRVCSSKLIKALCRVLCQGSSSTAKPRLERDVREVADRVLVVTTKGSTRWSQAILASLLSRIKFQR